MAPISSPVALLALLATLSLAGACTDGDGTTAAGEADASPTLEVPERPQLEVPEGLPPSELEVADLVEGEGPEVERGRMLTVHYVAMTWSGDEVTSSYDRGRALSYEYGEGRWVEGWTRGLEGMREGGRRRLVVPPGLGYGEQGAPGIPPGETLVFVVDLLRVG